MDVTEVRASFDEFVAGRWMALVRTAYLLTGNRHDAEDLLQSSLAKAAVKWESLDEAQAYVRQVLLGTASGFMSSYRHRARDSVSLRTVHGVGPVQLLD